MAGRIDDLSGWVPTLNPNKTAELQPSREHYQGLTGASQAAFQKQHNQIIKFSPDQQRVKDKSRGNYRHAGQRRTNN